MRLLLSLLAWAGIWAGTWAGAQAELATPQLIVKPLEPHPVGARVDVDVALIGNEDRPLSNQVLELYLDGEYLRRIRTAEDGTASLRISRALAIGSYDVTVSYIGTKDYTATSAALSLVIRPALLSVETVPPLAGIAFALNGQRFVSGQDGFARLELFEPGMFELVVLLEPETLLTPDTKASFSRWSDAVFTPKRSLEITTKDVALQVGFELSHPVQTVFYDLDEEPVDWSRVTAVTLKSSSAAYRTITQDDLPYWLQANRILRQRSGISVTPLLWSVESVMLDGSNVVNRYQQRYYVEPGATWAINLLLYQARIRSKDALFGFRVGTGVAMTYPDGSLQELDFDSNNELQMVNMARGLYKLQVRGVPGVAPVTPVAMTKNQEVELKVLSGFDIGTLLVTGLLLAFGLLFYGRPHLIGLQRRALSAPPLPALEASRATPFETPAATFTLPSETLPRSAEVQAFTVDAEAKAENEVAEPVEARVFQVRGESYDSALPSRVTEVLLEAESQAVSTREVASVLPGFSPLPIIVNGTETQLEPVVVDAKTQAAEAAARQGLLALFEERVQQLAKGQGAASRVEDASLPDSPGAARAEQQKTLSVVFKSTLVLSYLQGQASVPDLSVRHGIRQSVLHTWIAAFLEAGEARLQEAGDVSPEALQTEIAQLTYRLSEQATKSYQEKRI